MSETSMTPYGGFVDVSVAGGWREGGSGKSREDGDSCAGETPVWVLLADPGALAEGSVQHAYPL